MIRHGHGDINTRNGKAETPLIRAIYRYRTGIELVVLLVRNLTDARVAGRKLALLTLFLLVGTTFRKTLCYAF